MLLSLSLFFLLILIPKESPCKVHFIYCSIITVLWISALSTIPFRGRGLEIFCDLLTLGFVKWGSNKAQRAMKYLTFSKPFKRTL